MKKTKYAAGGGKSGMKNSKYMASGGMKTEVGKEAKVEQYRDYVSRMFGGGKTTTKGRAMGGRQDKRS